MYRQPFWQKHYDHPNFKRTKVWGNTRSIAFLDCGPLDRKKHRNETATTVKYKDSKGRVRYKGSSHLRKTQQLDHLYIDSQGFCGHGFGTTPSFSIIVQPARTPRLYPPKLAGKILSLRRTMLSTKPKLPPAAEKEIMVIRF